MHYINIIQILALAFYLTACSTTSIPKISYTPEEEAVRILSGEQATTLELTKTHVAVSTEKIISEKAIRARAVELNSDVAQLILTSNGAQSQTFTRGVGGTYYSVPMSNTSSTTYTIRFWKRK